MKNYITHTPVAAASTMLFTHIVLPDFAIFVAIAMFAIALIPKLWESQHIRLENLFFIGISVALAAIFPNFAMLVVAFYFLIALKKANTSLSKKTEKVA